MVRLQRPDVVGPDKHPCRASGIPRHTHIACGCRERALLILSMVHMSIYHQRSGVWDLQRASVDAQRSSRESEQGAEIAMPR